MSKEKKECKYVQSDMTPCYEKDGMSAVTTDGYCAGCNRPVFKIMIVKIAELESELKGKEWRIKKHQQRLDSLSAELAAYKDALLTLCDIQNGPPLIRDAKEWQAAMDVARELLRDWMPPEGAKP